MLERALAEYTGTVIVISHDRYFLDHVVDRIWELEGRPPARVPGRLERLCGGPRRNDASAPGPPGVSGPPLRIALIAPFGLRPKGTASARALPLGQALAARGHHVRLIVPPWDDPSRAAGRARVRGRAGWRSWS